MSENAESAKPSEMVESVARVLDAFAWQPGVVGTWLMQDRRNESLRQACAVIAAMKPFIAEMIAEAREETRTDEREQSRIDNLRR